MPANAIGPGDPAPGFELPDAEGDLFALADLLGRGPVVLFFVPHAPRGVCKRTECGLRDEYGELQAHGAEVLGVTAMGRRAVRRAVTENGLPFLLLADRDRAAHQAYGIGPTHLLLPARATFVLDRDGIVRWVERHPFLASRHTKGALRAVKRLAA